MVISKNELLQVLEEKNSPICETIIQHIDLFNETEMQQIYLILHQTDAGKLKELYLYQNSQAKLLLDRIIGIARELTHVEAHIEKEISTQNETHLEQFIEQSIDIHYSIS